MRKWFIVTTYSGLENSVKIDIERRKISMNMEDKIYSVLVPEEIVEVKDKKGNIKQKTVRSHPGYVFVELEMDKNPDTGKFEVGDTVWFNIRNTPHVTGILGSSGGGTKPVPLPDAEMQRILKASGVVVKQSLFEVGDMVTYGSMEGEFEVIAVLDDKNKVVIDMGGAFSNFEVPMSDVKKVEKAEENTENA